VDRSQLAAATDWEKVQGKWLLMLLLRKALHERQG